MVRTAAILFAFCLLAGPARAEDGHWMSLEADDGTKAGLVFPDYQPNNFSVFWMVCPTDGGPAAMIFEFPVDNLREGDEVPVTFVIDDVDVVLTARGVRDEFQGTTVLQIGLERNDAIFDRLAAAKTIVIKVADITFPTPIKGAWSAINNFTNLCRAG